ncbi:MAG: DUF4301 family protein [Bacteroidales bacterium]|nr:DUF4301 family protein [Bacteroidales bacterium]
MADLLSSFNQKDKEQIAKKGISFSAISEQITQFINGIPSINIVYPATINNSGIKKLSEETENHYLQFFNKKKDNLSIVKFVPASGAATRMFKDLFEFVSLTNSETPKDIQNLINNIEKFAFYEDLNEILKNQGTDLKTEIANKNYKTIVNLIISEEGLNYGNLPKGLLKFHQYNEEKRTSFEEHVVESLLYANSKNKSQIHFTVSPEHKNNFIELSQKLITKYSTTQLEIDFSAQNPSTDTIALNTDNTPFRDNENILFRPGGHGALIYNLNNINSDLIFIKNIDNVVPDYLKKKNCKYKKAIAGVLLEIQKKTFELIDLLLHNPSVETIQEAFNFVVNNLCVKIFFEFSELSGTEKIEFLLGKLDRPIRVCAMVKNEGEPGGGPFFVMQNDKTATLQIVEKAQIDLTKPDKKEIFDNSTHFNPVDIVLSPIRYNGEKFDLTKFIDPETGFISEKSKDGKILKALELPGLWNGAMANWNTLFVEVPEETFNPVKTIFDLLRDAHQNN